MDIVTLSYSHSIKSLNITNYLFSSVYLEILLVFTVLQVSHSQLLYRFQFPVVMRLFVLDSLIAQVVRLFILGNKYAAFLFTYRADVYFGVSVCVEE